MIHTLQTAVRHAATTALPSASREGMRSMPPIQLRDLLDSAPAAPAGGLDEVESINEIRKRFVTPGMSLGALGPEAHGALNIAMNRIGAKIVVRRRRRGPGPLPPAAQRRQPQLGGQADRVGPLRRHRRIPEQVPRDRDQGRPGRQARRRRPAARLQGHRADRPAAPRHAGRDADHRRRRTTTSIRSRIWPSSSTT